MPIKINLLAEQLAEVETRRKDPVKRTIWAVGTVVGLFVVYLIWGQFSFWKKRDNLNNLTKELEAKQDRIDDSTKRFLEVVGIEGKLTSLDRYKTNRFQWTLPLNALQFSTLPEIKVTSFKAKQYFTNSVAKSDSGIFPLPLKQVNERWPASDNPVAEIKKHFEGMLDERIDKDPLFTTNRFYLKTSVTAPNFNKRSQMYESLFKVIKPAYAIRFLEFTVLGRDFTDTGSQFKAFRDKIFNSSYFKEAIEKSDNISITHNSITREVDNFDREGPPFYRFTLFCRYPLDYQVNE